MNLGKDGLRLVPACLTQHPMPSALLHSFLSFLAWRQPCLMLCFALRQVSLFILGADMRLTEQVLFHF